MKIKCTHPNHKEGESCLEYAVGCHPDCECCIKKPEYSVTCGNIGYVHVGTRNYEEALGTFNEYKEQSLLGVGRAGNEEVTLWIDDEPMLIHN